VRVVTFLRCDTVKVVGAMVDMVPSDKGRVRFGPAPCVGLFAFGLIPMQYNCIGWSAMRVPEWGQLPTKQLNFLAVAFLRDMRSMCSIIPQKYFFAYNRFSTFRLSF
jgi:hypothetical protein